MTSSLYRSYLRVLEKWPVDASKKGRDLGEYIRICVAEAFRVSGPRDTAKCDQVQATLNRIASDRYKEAFYISGSTSFSASGLTENECKQLMSNEFLELMQQESSGLKEKVFGKAEEKLVKK